jgi:hypothetical protein
MLTMGFTLAYTRFAGGPGRIDAMSSCWHLALGVGFSQQTCNIVTKQGYPAVAEDTGTLSSIPPIVSMTVYVQALVSSTVASTASNLSLW